MPSEDATSRREDDEERLSARVRAVFVERRLVLLLGALACVAFPWPVELSFRMSGDVWWQLRCGLYILAHHAPPAKDLWSYTVPNAPFVDVEWGWQAAVAAAYRALGYRALWAFAALPVGATGALCVLRAARRACAPATSVLVGLLATTGLVVTDMRMRPLTFSFAFLAAVLLVLDEARRRPRLLLVLPALFCVWANVHGSYLLGLGVLVLETVLSFCAPSRAARWLREGRIRAQAGPPGALVAVTAGSVLATFATPFGPSGLVASLRLSANPQIARSIVEWMSPDFHDLALLLVVGAPLAWSVVGLAVSDQPVDARDLLLTGTLLAASLYAVRMVPYFVIAWAGVASAHSPLDPKPLRAATGAFGLFIAVTLAAATTRPARAGVPAGVPVKLIEAGQRFAAERHGHLLTTYRNGDWEVWAGIPDFIDGRTQLYTAPYRGGPSILEDYRALSSLSSPPAPILSRFHVEAVVWPRSEPLTWWLADSSDWHWTSSSDTWVLFENRR